MSNPTTAITSGLLTNGSAAAVASQNLASVILPPNALCFLDVINYHSTPANLSSPPTVVGSGGETWVQLATITPGVASPTQRVTRYATMVSAATTTIVGLTFSGSQTGIGWFAQWVTGVRTSGANGAGAIGQVITASTSTNQTSFPGGVAIGQLSNPRNALYAVFSSSNATAVTPRPGWTENLDQNYAGGRFEVQSLIGQDTLANLTAASSLLTCIVTELVCATTTITVREIVATSINGAASFVVPFNVVAGRQYLIWWNVYSGAITASLSVIAGLLTYTEDLFFTSNSGLFRQHYGHFSIPTFTGFVNALFTFSSAPGNSGVAIFEVTGFDTSVGGGTGIRQMKTGTIDNVASNNPLVIAMDPLTSRDDPMLAIYNDGSNSGPYASSIQLGWQVVADNAINAVAVCPRCYWKGNGDVNPIYTEPGPQSATFGGVVYEFAAAPGDNPPVVALVSPAQPGPVGPTAAPVIDTTDVDGDLATVTITANGETVYTTAGGFTTNYLTLSTVNLILNGLEFSIAKNGGWTSSTLGVTVVATDSQGHTTTGNFQWTTTVSAASTSFWNPGPARAQD